MQNIPVLLSGYRITVVDPPAPKMREDGSTVVNRDGVTQFVVSLFAKAKAQPGQRVPKGEEIKVTLETDPGQGFEEGARVELMSPQVSPYEIKGDNGRVVSGVSFRAMGLTLAAPPRSEK